MSNSASNSPKPATASAQSSPSGWTTAQPGKTRGHYASPTASSSSSPSTSTTTGRAKSRTLDSISSKTTSPPGAPKEKKVTLRRNTERSVSPTPATTSSWVSAKKGVHFFAFLISQDLNPAHHLLLPHAEAPVQEASLKMKVI